MKISSLNISPQLIRELELKSVHYRKTILSMIKHANSGHTGGSLSCVDILNVLYNCVLTVNPLNPTDPNRDRYIHSKGHSVEALYVVLADLGFLPVDELYTFEKYGSRLIGHPTRKVPGIEQNTGALGHGLSTAVGMALAAKKNKQNYRVFTLLGDGELTEGSVWEACMSASHYQLDNLIVIVDRNGFQITGPTEEVMGLEPLEEKFKSFGFNVRSVNGNHIPDLLQTLKQLPFEAGKPSLILALTVKGKGVSFMENNASWHHRVPNDQEFNQAIAELEQIEHQLMEIASQ